MPSSQKEETKQVQSNTIDPQSMALLQDNYSTAKGNSASLATPFTGPLTAGFNPTQIQAQGILSSVGTNPLYTNTANDATASAQGIMGADTFSAADLAKYMNPFQDSVIDASINQNERGREIARNTSHMQDSAGSAFGGSRSGVADALTNESYDRNDQTNIANLNSANFTQAQQASLAAKQLGLTAATTTANLNNNGLQTAATQGGILGAVGDAQQQQQQGDYDRIYNNWLQGKQLTLQEQNILNSALGMIPVQQTVNSSGTNTTTSNPGLGGILSSIGKIGMTAAAFA